MTSDNDAASSSSSTSDDEAATNTTITTPPTTTAHTTRARTPHISWSDSYTKAQMAIDSLSSILPAVPASLSASETPALALLSDSETARHLTTLLRQPDSGGGDNNLCRWLYDTFQTSLPDLQLVVLRFLPVLAGVYLSRASLHKPLAGFEAVLLALYAHETNSRNGQAITVSIPDISHSSIYHESKQPVKNSATELNMAVISPSLEPHSRVRSTRRARIVGVAVELYYSKISQMPVDSKVEFCEFCRAWAGENGDDPETQSEEQGPKDKEGRINLPWEIWQPILRILGHCLIGPDRKNAELCKAAGGACRALYARSLHDINPKAILATGSLLKLAKIDQESVDEVDHTEIDHTDVISL